MTILAKLADNNFTDVEKVEIDITPKMFPQPRDDHDDPDNPCASWECEAISAYLQDCDGLDAIFSVPLRDAFIDFLEDYKASWGDDAEGLAGLDNMIALLREVISLCEAKRHELTQQPAPDLSK